MSEYDEQTRRIKLVFGSREIPTVTSKTIRAYFAYLKKNH
jgi:hypothetical protein